MMRSVLVAGILGIALAAQPLSAQQSQPPQSQPEQSEPAAPPQPRVGEDMVGLPVFSSDGQKLGAVTEVGELAGGHQAIRAEMGELLGIGSTPVVMASDMFQKKADRIELAMTAAEVRKTIARQRQRPDRD